MSARPPQVSVIVPTLNRRADLLEFCASLRAQTVRPLELIVVDAGQVTDMEQALIEALAGSGIGLTYRRSRAGTSLQRNVALDLVREIGRAHV
jgi:glycosyltransferase involved in cell wall biosynthesis